MICFLAAGLVVANLHPASPRQAKNPKNRNTPPVESKVVNEVRPVVVESDRATDLPKSELVLYVTGAVRAPGVYKLPAESRLLHLVEAAGGFSASADPAAVNLAAVLEDGLHVHVLEKGEAPSQLYGGSTPGSATRGGISGSRKPIDVNRASIEELTALKGIGPALAGNIVEYRSNNGRFHDVDDLLHVKGIGRNKLAGFRDQVTVGP